MLARHDETATPSNEAAPLHPPGALGEADLRRIEGALLDALLDVGSGRANALDRLLDDMTAADGADDDTASAADRDSGRSRRRQIEELLVAAVSDTHPDRNRALDRILGGIGDANASGPGRSYPA